MLLPRRSRAAIRPQGGPALDRLRRLGQAVRGHHGRQPAGVAMGAGAGRCVWNDHQSRPAATSASRAISRSPTRRSAIRSRGTRRGRIARRDQLPQRLFIQALARNTGQVLGTFANFKPERIGPYAPPAPPTIRYGNTSANFVALQSLEEVVKLRLHHGQKRSSASTRLAKQGEALFQEHCKGCHNSEQPSSSARGPRRSRRSAPIRKWSWRRSGWSILNSQGIDHSDAADRCKAGASIEGA